MAMDSSYYCSNYQAAAAAAAPWSRPWSKAEDKAFENALVLCPEHAPGRWERVAAHVPGRSPREAWEHYQALVADVDLIERGAVDVPACWNHDEDGDDDGTAARRAGKARGEERRRGIPWSEEEHKYGIKRLKSSLSLSLSVPRCSWRFEILPHWFVQRRSQLTN